MSDISKIGLIKPDGNIHSAKNRKESLATGKEFENQLLETVEKLKTLDSAVDAMMESTSPKNVRSIEQSQRTQHKDIAAENFTAANRTSAKSTKYVALQYEQSKTNKS